MCFWGFMSSFNLSSCYSLQLQVNLKMLHVCHLPSLRKQLTFHYASSCATIPRSEISASDWMKQISNQSEALCGSGLCMSTVWNFYARFSDVISWGNHRWHSEKLAVFPGYNSFQGLKLRLPFATKNSVLATRISKLVASWRLVKLVVIVDFHVRRK